MSPSFSLLDFASHLAVFLLSLSAHEAAHAWTAKKLGDRTAYLAGQVTLDPTPHIKREPIGMLAIPIISYLFGGWMIGWTSVPVNVAWAQKTLPEQRRSLLPGGCKPLSLSQRRAGAS